MFNRRNAIRAMLASLAPLAFGFAAKADTDESNFTLDKLEESPLGHGERKLITSCYGGRDLHLVRLDYETGYEEYVPMRPVRHDSKITKDTIELYSNWSQRLANGEGQLSINGIDFILSKSSCYK